MSRGLIAAGLMVLAISTAGGAEVSGRVELPEVCSPEISPAVVSLERAEEADRPARSGPEEPPRWL